MRENVGQNNFEYGHFSRSVCIFIGFLSYKSHKEKKIKGLLDLAIFFHVFCFQYNFLYKYIITFGISGL